jgi:RimJ/RimL family protein N-acetyltransferase
VCHRHIADDRDPPSDPARAGHGRCAPAGAADERLRHRENDQPRAHPYGQTDAEDFVALCQGGDPRTGRNFLLDLEDEGVVGGLGFFTPPDGRLEVGYWIGRDWWGRGLATEALSGALAWAGRDWRRRYVVAGHFADNPASGQVLIKAGFLYTGEVRALPSRARGEPADTRMMVWLA